jgi:hypothetical protein
VFYLVAPVIDTVLRSLGMEGRADGATEATGGELCAICHDDLEGGGGGAPHALPCEHRFHVGCVLNWFRRGAQTCPSCRDPGLPPEESPIGALALHARASSLRRHAQRKNAPKELLYLVGRVKKAEANLRQVCVASRDFRSANRDVLKQGRKLRSEEMKALRARTGALRTLGLYEDGNTRLPALLIHSGNPNDIGGGVRQVQFY